MSNENQVSVIGKFRHLGTAVNFAATGLKPMRVIMGDDGYFWIVTPAVAARLESAGYEQAN